MVLSFLMMDANKKFGLKIIAIAVMFGFFETWYFGWNSITSSYAEAICDGIALMLCGYGLSFTDKKRTFEKDCDLTF